jgi:quinol monooxygenase YgiN
VSGEFVVVVDFRLRPGARAAFRALIDENAIASVRDEPGCRRFDVVEVRGDPERVLLYEIYDDPAAFDAHRDTAHFARFDAASGPLVASKTVIAGDLVCAGGVAPED